MNSDTLPICCHAWINDVLLNLDGRIACSVVRCVRCGIYIEVDGTQTKGPVEHPGAES